MYMAMGGVEREMRRAGGGVYGKERRRQKEEYDVITMTKRFAEVPPCDNEWTRERSGAHRERLEEGREGGCRQIQSTDPLIDMNILCLHNDTLAMHVPFGHRL